MDLSETGDEDHCTDPKGNEMVQETSPLPRATEHSEATAAMNFVTKNKTQLENSAFTADSKSKRKETTIETTAVDAHPKESYTM